MRIYVLPVDERFRPGSQPFRYPSHNRDYGVEQDFLGYLEKESSLLTSRPDAADWHYLPIFWTRWHLNHDYARSGLEELQREVDRVLLDDKKTITVCQYDDGPLADLGDAVQFLASRRTHVGLDIPLLSAPHRRPLFPPRKTCLASFVGRLSTHPIRGQMAETLRHRDDIVLVDGDRGTRFFVRQSLASRLVLAPRGYGGSSFRFFEAMQLGVPPILVGDLDTRPFKRQIEWDTCSFYAPDSAALGGILDRATAQPLSRMGEAGARTYREHLAFGKWGELVIRELESLR
jgi:hypothetical protein